MIYLVISRMVLEPCYDEGGVLAPSNFSLKGLVGREYSNIFGADGLVCILYLLDS